MTEKLYYSDAYLFEFFATVISCEKQDKNYNIILDRTAFFPEEGGQCHDFGTIDGNEIIFVKKQGDDIIHTINSEIEVGKKVFCKVDAKIRFRNMQTHSGEHIVSGLICSKFNMKNVGFHLGSEITTADYDGKLDRKNLDFIEDAANEIVFKNKIIKAWFPSDEELKNIEYRHKSKIFEDIRIVEIPECDLCACCAPHVNRTGEIGLIKIVGFEAYKGGTRIYIKCGQDALCDYREKSENILAVSALLSAQQNESSAAVERLYNEYKDIKRQLRIAREENLRLKLKSVEFSENIQYFQHDSNDMNELRIIADELSEKTNSFAVAVNENNSICNFSIISKCVSITELSCVLRKEISARCGGKDDIIQGNAPVSFEKFEEVINNWYFAK